MVVVIGAIGGLVVTIAGLRSQEKAKPAFEAAVKAWEEEQRQWEAWYYCSRDDILFDPETQDVWTFRSQVQN